MTWIENRKYREEILIPLSMLTFEEVGDDPVCNLSEPNKLE
jgi:hypothetical protein